MLDAIRTIKVKGPGAAPRATLLAASEELSKAGAELQFVACSEFSLIADGVSPDANVLDTVDLLTDAIIKTSQAGSTGKPA